MILILWLVLHACSSDNSQWEADNYTKSTKENLAVITASTQLGTLSAKYELGKIWVQYKKGKIQPEAIYVYDSVGQLLYGENRPRFNSNSSLKIDFQNMPAGDYLVKALMGENRYLEDWIVIDP